MGENDDVIYSHLRGSIKRPFLSTTATVPTTKDSEIERTDVRCIESLRWLLYRPDSRIEAVSQANSYVNACLVRMSKRDISDLIVRAEARRGAHATYLWGEIKKIQYL